MGRQFQVLETWNPVGDDAHDDGAGTTLAEDVDAEARGVFQAIREIGGAVLLEFLGGVLIFPEEEFGDLIGVTGDRHSRPLNFSSTSWPLTSTCGARPGEKMRALTCSRAFSMAPISCGTLKLR